MISYSPLWETMRQRDVSTYALIHKYGINPRTINNLKHNKSITMFTLERLCEILNCEPNDVIRFENKSYWNTLSSSFTSFRAAFYQYFSILSTVSVKFEYLSINAFISSKNFFFRPVCKSFKPRKDKAI